MGYITRDAVGPAVTAYVAASFFKNRMLMADLGWPTTTIDGRLVFGRLYYYQNGVGVYKTPRHLAIYKLLNMDVGDLEAQSYEGVENAYLYVRGVNIEYAVTRTEAEGYIEEFSPLIYPDNPDPFNPDPNPDPITDLNPDPFKGTEDAQWDSEGWITSYITYTPPTSTQVNEFITDAEVIALINANDKNTLWYDSEDSSRLTALALLDSSNVMFEKNIQIRVKELEQKTTYVRNRHKSYQGSNSARYIKSVIVEYKFRRILDPADVAADGYMAAVAAEVAALDDIHQLGGFVGRRVKTVDFIANSTKSSFAEQLIDMYDYVVPITETALNYGGYLKVDGMSALKVRDFMEIFVKQIASGHQQKKTKWYKKLLVVIVDIIVVVVAVVVFIVTGGNLAAVSFVFALGAMVQTALAAYWVKNGDYAAAQYASKHAMYLGTAAQIAAIANIFYGDPGLMEKIAAATMAVAKATKNEDLELAASIAALISSGYAMTQSTSNLMLTGVSALNQSFTVYSRYISPPDKGIEELQGKLVESERELEDLSGPEKIDTVEREFSDPYTNYIDVNEKMQGMPYLLTHGRNAALMEKYYDSNY